MKLNVALSVALTVPTGFFILLTALLPSFGSESYLFSDLKCSMRLERVLEALKNASADQLEELIRSELAAPKEEVPCGVSRKP
jgi:hypothetical protein